MGKNELSQEDIRDCCPGPQTADPNDPAWEIWRLKQYADRLYDRIETLRTDLLRKQQVLDRVAELVAPLLDADSGADRHEVAEHILSVIREGQESAC